MTNQAHPATRAAKRRAQGRDRAARWRERHAAEIAALRAASAAAEAELAALRDAAAAAAVDAAIAAGLVQRHAEARRDSDTRDVPIPMVDVLAAARVRLRAAGMEREMSIDIVRDRVAHHARAIPNPDTCASPASA